MTEIKDRNTKQRLALQPYDFCFREPSDESLRMETIFKEFLYSWKQLLVRSKQVCPEEERRVDSTPFLSAETVRLQLQIKKDIKKMSGQKSSHLTSKIVPTQNTSLNFFQSNLP